jgi:hypothetical protein
MRSPVEIKRPFYTPEREYSSQSASASQSIGAKSAAVFKLEVFPDATVGPRREKFSYDSRTGIFTSTIGLAGREREIGTEIKRLISSIRITENEEMTSQLSMSFVNPRLLFTNKNVLKEGDHVVVYLGYGTDIWANENRFSLVRTHPKFPRDGVPTLDLVGRDGRYMMINKEFISQKRGASPGTQGTKKPPTSFKGTDSQIMDQIAYHYGFAVDLDTTKKKRTRIRKKGTSIWEFVLAIAKENNFTAWVDWSDTYRTWILHFRKRQAGWEGGREFTYSSQTTTSTLLNFEPVRDASRQVTDIEIVHFDRKNKYVDKQWLSYSDKSIPPPPPDPDEFDFTKNKEYGARLVFKLEGRMIDTFSNRPFKNKAQAKAYATRLVNEYQSDFMPATGTLIGTENIRPRQIHALSGVDEFSGFYYFTDVTHRVGVDFVYETDFVGYRILDNTVTQLIRRGQLVSKWQGSEITGAPPPPDLD